MLEIKDIRFSQVSGGFNDGIKGRCSINLSDLIVIHGIKLKRVHGQLKVFLPERKVGKEGEYKPVVTYLDKNFREILYEQVIEAYNNHVIH